MQQILLEKDGVNMENITHFLNDFSLLIVAISATIVAILKSYKNTKKEIDTLPKKIKQQVNIDDSIISKMEDLKELLNADRVQIYDFHNRDHYANGRSALKTSCTYEVIRTGISHKQSYLQSIPLSCLSRFISKLMNDGFLEVKNLEEIKDEMPSTYQLKNDMEINSFYDVILNNKNGEPIGFLAVQYVKNKYNILSEKDKQEVLKLKFFIEEQLEKM